MKEEIKNAIADIAVRAAKTFFQAFLSSVSIDMLLGITDLDTLKRVGISMLVAATAAGLSAVTNAALKALNAGKGGSLIEKN